MWNLTSITLVLTLIPNPFKPTPQVPWHHQKFKSRIASKVVHKKSKLEHGKNKHALDSKNSKLCSFSYEMILQSL
jgi:hypothetical protein